MNVLSLKWRYRKCLAILILLITIVLLLPKLLQLQEAHFSLSYHGPQSAAETANEALTSLAMLLESDLNSSKSTPWRKQSEKEGKAVIAIPVSDVLKTPDKITPKLSLRNTKLTVQTMPKKLELSISAEPMTWERFLKSQPATPFTGHVWSHRFNEIKRDIPFKACTTDVETKLNQPSLSNEEFEWCQWALQSGTIYTYHIYAICNRHLCMTKSLLISECILCQLNTLDAHGLLP
jgi:hypothetical protein